MITITHVEFDHKKFAKDLKRDRLINCFIWIAVIITALILLSIRDNWFTDYAVFKPIDYFLSLLPIITGWLTVDRVQKNKKKRYYFISTPEYITPEVYQQRQFEIMQKFATSQNNEVDIKDSAQALADMAGYIAKLEVQQKSIVALLEAQNATIQHIVNII